MRGALKDKELSAYLGRRWQDHAACGGIDGELFYQSTQTAEESIVEAKSLCASCPVLVSCRAFALRSNEKGVWGGTTDDERMELCAALRKGVPVDAVLALTGSQ